MNQVKKNYNQYIPYLLFTLCTFALLLKTRYSFCWSDETFYASTTHRFYQGDSIFYHEWFPTQLVSLLLLPLHSLFVTITGSTTGIFLFFRICYVFFSLAVSLTTFHILKKTYSVFISLCCALFYFFYAHLNIATLSYYTMSVGFYLLAMLLIYDSINTADYKKRKLIAGGVFFAASVICLPSMAVAYFICSSVLILCCIKNRELRSIFPYTLVGIVSLAVIILIYVFSKISIKDIIDTLPFVLSDEEHVTSLIYPFKKFFISILEVYGKCTYISYFFILLTFVFGRRLRPLYKQLLMLCNVFLFFIYYYFSIGHTGYISTAFILFALPCYFMTTKRNKPLLFLLYGSGLVFAMVFSYSSNGYLYIMTLGHSISAIGSICFTSDFMKELLDDSSVYPLTTQKLFFTLVTLIIGITLIQTMTLRMVNIYRDAPLSRLTKKITVGPAAGLYTTEQHLSDYQMVYETIQTYCTNDNGTIFFTKLLPWGYLATDMKCAAPTTWRTKFSSERLPVYYQEHPEKLPDMIFVLDEEIGSYDACGDVEADPTPNENEVGGWLLEYVTENNYEIINTDCGVIYRK